MNWKNSTLYCILLWRKWTFCFRTALSITAGILQSEEEKTQEVAIYKETSRQHSVCAPSFFFFFFSFIHLHRFISWQVKRSCVMGLWGRATNQKTRFSGFSQNMALFLKTKDFKSSLSTKLYRWLMMTLSGGPVPRQGRSSNALICFMPKKPIYAQDAPN